MAGIGNEVRPHTVDTPRFALIAEKKNKKLWPTIGITQRLDHRFVPTVNRHALEIVDATWFTVCNHTLDKRMHFRCTKTQIKASVLFKRLECINSSGIGKKHSSTLIEDDHRIGQQFSQPFSRNIRHFIGCMDALRLVLNGIFARCTRNPDGTYNDQNHQSDTEP